MRLRRLVADESHIDGPHHRLRAVGDPQLADYALHVDLRCPLAYHEGLRDLLVGLSRGQQLQDLRFARCQRIAQWFAGL